MSNTNTFIAAVVDELNLQFSDELNTCVALPGYLETTDISVVHANTPGVFVASVGTGEIIPVETGEQDITLQMAAYLLIVDQDSIQREQTAQDLLTNLLAYISRNGQRWGVANTHPSRAVESADVHGLTRDFEPHVKDWRLGIAVLARAEDLYGADDPISNLALWVITWEQILRVGENDFDDDGQVPPYAIYSDITTEDGYIELTLVADGIDGSQLTITPDTIAGTLIIHKAEDETYVTDYNLYWGSGPGEKLAGQDVIASIAKTGADLNYVFVDNTPIPDDATHLLVYTQNNNIEEKAGVSLYL